MGRYLISESLAGMFIDLISIFQKEETRLRLSDTVVSLLIFVSTALLWQSTAPEWRDTRVYKILSSQNEQESVSDDWNESGNTSYTMTNPHLSSNSFF